jgi:tetratricopeptide (TPR) repeat protein
MLDAIGDTTIGGTASRAPVVGDAVTAGAFALLAAGKYSEALAELRLTWNSVEQRPNRSPDTASPLAHFVRARSDEAAGRIPEARRGYETALAGTLAGRGLLHVGIGRLAQVEGDVAGAIEAFGRAVRLNPNDPVAHRELAGALAADDRIDDAFAELVAALLIDPADVSVLAAIGQLFLDNGRHAEAVVPLRRTLQLAPGRFETHYALATALTHLGETADAAREREHFERGRQQMVEKRRRELDADAPGGER